MKIFNSSLGNIYTGDIRDGLGKVIDPYKASSVFIVADENTAALCVPVLEGIVDYKDVIICKSGEKNKNLSSCQSIWSALIKGDADRDTLILNVGGGMVGDLGGFAAACYQRGIRFGQIPTTVLSMADASIGGKLGVDYEGLKNYIGIIRVPSFIWIDHTFLNTLPRIEIISGLAEIVKHAIIGSPSLWNLLEGVNSVENIPWNEVFDLNTPVKVNIVESDLTEQGRRKLLNFGHTIGHALESFYLATDHPMTHGQCVALGMLVESRISSVMGLLNPTDFEAITGLILRLLHPEMTFLPDFALVRPWIMKDKKKSGGKVGFSLPDAIGNCRWDIPVEDNTLKESFDWLHAQAKSVPFRLSMDK